MWMLHAVSLKQQQQQQKLVALFGKGYMTVRAWGLCGGGLSQGMSSEGFSLLPDC